MLFGSRPIDSYEASIWFGELMVFFGGRVYPSVQCPVNYE